MVRVQLTGGGPGDGEEFEITSLESQTKLQEKRYGDGFFWAFLYGCDSSGPHVYVEQDPHFEPDFVPPRTLELWYDNRIALSDFH